MVLVRDSQGSVRSFLPRVKCGLRPPPLVAGPVRSSLRCGRPARRRRTPKDPMTEDGSPQATGPVLSDHVVVVRPGRPSPQPILVTVDHPGQGHFVSLAGSRCA
jgi:hypothetical protein